MGQTITVLTPEQYDKVVQELNSQIEGSPLPAQGSASSKSDDFGEGSDNEGDDGPDDPAAEEDDETAEAGPPADAQIQLASALDESKQVDPDMKKDAINLMEIMTYYKFPNKLKKTRAYVKSLASKDEDKAADEAKAVKKEEKKAAEAEAKLAAKEEKKAAKEAKKAAKEAKASEAANTAFIGGEPQDGGLSLNPFKKSMPEDPRIQELAKTYEVESNGIFPKYDIVESVINPRSKQFGDAFKKLYDEKLHDMFRRPEFYKDDKMEKIKGEKDDMKEVFKNEVQKLVLDLAIKEYIRFIYNNVMIRLSWTDQFKAAFARAGGDATKLKTALENVAAMEEFLTPDVRLTLDKYRHKRKNEIKKDLLDSEDAKLDLDNLAGSLKSVINNMPTPEAPASTEAAPTEAAPTEAAATEATPTEAAPTEAAPTEAASTEAENNPAEGNAAPPKVGGGKIFVRFAEPKTKRRRYNRRKKSTTRRRR
jgi:hypothetical protein